MAREKLSALLVLALGLNASAFAQNIRVVGVNPGYVPVYKEQSSGMQSLASTPVQNKPIVFQKIILSEAAQQYLAKHITDQDAPTNLAAAATHLSGVAPQLGMNGVPPLDQGQHGTCATFAVTAALDAVKGQTDYISQLCNLELGSYLSSLDSHYQSGWDGSTNDTVLTQIQKYGVINKDYQQKYGCAGVKVYPGTDSSNTGNPMKTDDFTPHAEKIMASMSYKTLLDGDTAFTPEAHMDDVLNSVKTAINNGHRLVIGTLIDESIGGNGTAGTYNNISGDSWVMTPIIQKHAKANKINSGHAMVVIGYDDNAVIKKALGKTEKGVITLRNSWGPNVGDHGNYYMSYDYFKTLVWEVKEIVPNS